MALIQCPECELQVSDKALSCPHCGYPLKEKDQTKGRGKAKPKRKGFQTDSEVSLKSKGEISEIRLWQEYALEKINMVDQC